MSPTRYPKRDAGDARRTLHLEAAELGVLLRLGERRRLAPARDLDRVVLAVTVGGRLVRRVRHLQEQRVALGLGSGERLLGGAQLLLHLLELLELLGRRLPFSFVRLRSSSTFGTSARQRSSAASSASNASRGALPRERGAERRPGRCARP